MKYNIVIGNPPYQEADGGHGASARAIYYKFVEMAIDQIMPDHLSFIIPAKWFVGGREPISFRKRMMGDRHMKSIKDYPDWRDVFPDNKIRGGVMWFHRDKDHDHDCDFNGTQYDLAQYPEVIVRQTEAHTILDKVFAKSREFVSADVRSTSFFGVDSHGEFDQETDAGVIPCHTYMGVKHIGRERVKNHEVVAMHKAMTHSTNYCGDTGFEKVLFEPWLMMPGEISSRTYIVLLAHDDDAMVENFLAYSHTKFFRFLTSLKIITHHNSKKTFGFVPAMDYSRIWNDADLYAHFGLTDEEVGLIESEIARYPSSKEKTRS